MLYNNSCREPCSLHLTLLFVYGRSECMDVLIITFHPVLWYGCRSRSIKNQIKTFDDIKELSILSFPLIIYVNKMVSNWKTPMAAPGHRNACEMTHDTERGPLALSEHCVCFSPFLIFFLCPQMDTSSPAMLGNTGGRSQLASSFIVDADRPDGRPARRNAFCFIVSSMCIQSGRR